MYLRIQRLFAWLLLSSVCVLFFILSGRENPVFKPHYVLLVQLSRLLSSFDRNLTSTCNLSSNIAFLKPRKTIEDATPDPESAHVLDSLLQHCGCMAGRLALFVFTLAAFTFIVALRYGELIVTSLELFIKFICACDWNSFMTAVGEAYQCVSKVLGYLVCFYLQLNTIQRISVCFVAASPLAAWGFKSKGANGILQASPIGLLLMLYALAFQLCSARVIAWASWALANFTIAVWGLYVLWRYYNLASDAIIVAGTEKKVTDVTTLLSMETSNLLELCFATFVLRFATALPLVSNVYNDIVSFLALAAVLSQLVFFFCGNVDFQKDTLAHLPLARLNKCATRLMNHLTFKTLGSSTIFARGAEQNKEPKSWLHLPGAIIHRIHSGLCLVLGPQMGIPEDKYNLLTQALKWLKMLPQMLLLVLPNFVSRLYYDYCTRIAPAIEIATLPADATLAAKVKTLVLVLASDVLTKMVNPLLLHWLPLYTLIRLAQLIGLQFVTGLLSVKRKRE